MTSSPMTDTTMRELVPGVRVRDADGNLGVVIRLEDACWERTRYRWTHTIFPDPMEGHVLVRLDQPIHALRHYFYAPEHLHVVEESND